MIRQSGLPIQTATAILGVKPTVQASAKLSDVPVFTATCQPGIVNCELRPKIIARFSSFDIIVAMMKATFGSTT